MITTGQRPMTLAYASPEQIRGQQTNTQSDVYSLGILLYELLAERLPFDLANKSLTEAERIVLEQPIEPPSVVAHHGPALSKSALSDLDVVCLTAMHRDQQRRYRSAEALIRDIDHYLKNEPLEGAAGQPGLPAWGIYTPSPAGPFGGCGGGCHHSGSDPFLYDSSGQSSQRSSGGGAAASQRDRAVGMLNVFDGGDKTAAPADTLRAVALIDRGVQSAPATDNEPDFQADLYQTLGNIYQKLEAG